MTTRVKIFIAFIAMALSITLLNNLGVFDNFFPGAASSSVSTAAPVGKENAAVAPTPPAPRRSFGLALDSFEVIHGRVKRGETFGTILLDYGISYAQIHRLAHDFRDTFDVRRLRRGKPYTLFCERKDSAGLVARHMVYQPNAVQYVKFDLTDSLQVLKQRKEVSTQRRVITGDIQSSLYETILEVGGSPALVMDLSTIYAWTIDFFRIDKGDNFKLIYEEQFVDDTVSIGSGRILACDFEHGERSFYSFWYAPDSSYSDYFDEKGQTLRKAFLRAPLNYYRISSRYQRKRFHPVLKHYRSHLGTDYAAPRGTPIMATADGKVIAASYTRGNGNYVKIRHNSTYTTQYLHMTRFADNMRRGKVVKQGDVIGYVGSTGLATGPHVCYRFWVNGRQVDPYKQDLPEAEPIKEAYRDDYMNHMKDLKRELDELPEPGSESVQLAGVGS